MPENKQNNQNNNNKKKFDWSNIAFIVLLGIFVVSLVFSTKSCSKKNTTISITEGFQLVQENKVKSVTATTTNDSSLAASYIITLVTEDKSTLQFNISSEEQWVEFCNVCTSTENGHTPIKVTYTTGSTFSIWTVLFYGSIVLGIVFLIVIIVRSTKQISSSNGMGSTFDFTKSRAKMSKGVKTTFKDVAGLDEEKEELQEIVDFLKNPQKYHELGARVPKGVLLFGKPGTGKTLLARAVAGEAGVPFFYTTGSDLVEMFVGVGASRVRDMFKTAKKNSPSILFMDEIDAIGRQRGTGLGGGNDEREQTLNQLLVEMDGFGQNTNIIIMAATNRVDILDPALLRPGRFDRQINVSTPDIKGREEILKVHARGKKVSKDVDYKAVAHQTPGFTGADLENVMNEAALLSARVNKKEIDMPLIGEAIDRVMMGPAKKSRVISKKEKELIAYHEAGHCVIGTLLSNADIVQKVTIIPRGEAGGYNLMGPKDEETVIYSRNQLIERITGLLGGRTAEEIIFGEVTTGASNDMVNATAIARAMVTEYGMSKLGPITYEKNSGYVFLGRDYSQGKSFSDQVAHEIDEEIREIISECHNNAAKLLKDNIDKLKSIASYLLKTETLLKADIDEIFKTGKLKRVDDEEKIDADNLGTEATSTTESSSETKTE